MSSGFIELLLSLGQAKCEWLKSIGADVSLNYKSPDFVRELEGATPDGVDLYVY